MSPTTLLVVDVGSSSVRSAGVAPDATVRTMHQVGVPPRTPAPGLVEVDARRIAEAVLETANAVVADVGAVAAVGITNQRATTVVWDRGTGEPVGPALSWQDLRTAGTCLAMQADGFRFPPNASATKLAAILNEVDPRRDRDLCFGTIDAWVAWTLSGGTVHATDTTNAAVTWMVRTDAFAWDRSVLDALGIPDRMLPRIVDSVGFVGEAQALAGSPPICGIAGDQQASLVGQGCTTPGSAKATFGTGGMLDLCTGRQAPAAIDRNPAGTFPIVAWSRNATATWGVEAIMLTAGACVDWLRDDLGLLSSAEQSSALAAACERTDDVWFVPALLGLGTPVWDLGARGTLIGVTRGTDRHQLVRAVLEGIAHRGADLLEAAENDSGLHVERLRVDGGMSANEVFVQALADAIGRPIDVSRTREATTLGAGFLAGLALGLWRDELDVAASYRPGRSVEPAITDVDRCARRARWLEARSRAERTIPELSALSF